MQVNGGADNLAAAGFSTSAQPAAMNYMALTANSSSPVFTNSSLTGEIATSGGGLIRKQATYAHTSLVSGGSTSTTWTVTLTATFTANSSDSKPVTIAKIGIFNAVTSGTMGYETQLSGGALISNTGDAVTITETLTVTRS